MPNQDSNNQQQNNPNPGISFASQTDLPPMPADFQNVEKTEQIENKPVKDSGTASPVPNTDRKSVV